MTPKIKIDTLRADAAFKRLAAFMPTEVKEVIKGEAGAILKKCFKSTDVATAETVTIRERLNILMNMGQRRSPDDERVSLNIGKRGPYGRVYRVIPQPEHKRGSHARSIQQTHADNFVPLNRHYRADTWHDITRYISKFRAEEARKVPLAVRARGLTAQSWLQIADAAGIDLEKVKGGGRISKEKMKLAREAMASDGRRYTNGASKDGGTGKKYEITLMNMIPWSRAAKLDTMLAAAVMGRVRYFEKNLEKGVFDSISKMLKAYPNIRITPPAGLALADSD